MNNELQPIDGTFRLPDKATTTDKLREVRDFQTLVRSSLTQGHDFGKIPGTQSPTLLKPGAEKIAKLLGLADTYSVTHRIEDWERPLFAYEIKCQLVSIQTGVLVAEGIGSCNTMEDRYRWRWVWDRELPPNWVDDGNTKTRSRNNDTQYRIENPDVYSLVNTVLKMAKKRALVDAALSVGSLSDLFTQDMEDHAPVVDHSAPPEPRVEHSKVRSGYVRVVKEEADPEFNFSYFWKHAHEIVGAKGKEGNQRVHSILGLESMRDYPGTPDEALEALRLALSIIPPVE